MSRGCAPDKRAENLFSVPLNLSTRICIVSHWPLWRVVSSYVVVHRNGWVDSHELQRIALHEIYVSYRGGCMRRVDCDDSGSAKVFFSVTLSRVLFMTNVQGSTASTLLRWPHCYGPTGSSDDKHVQGRG